MEITRANFSDTLPLIREAIDECTFCAIDTELTGLKVQNLEHAFDTMDERYMKLWETSKNFLIIQFGLSCFRYFPDTKKYTHKDFNFYIFPQQHCSQAPDQIFICQASSLTYLASNGFDFNKLINEGISYLKPSQEQNLLQSLKTFHSEKLKFFNREKTGSKNQKEPKHLPRVPNEHKDFINEMNQKVNTFVSNNSEGTLSLPPCNAYRRKLIYETVLPKHPSGLSMATVQNEKKQSYISVTKATEEEKLNQLQLKEISDMDDLDNAVGFRKVLEFISESKKLVVGHNMLLDILHTVDQFFYPLPQALSEFKDMTKCIFPHLVDTKTLVSSHSLKDLVSSTALFTLWEDIQLKSFPLPEVEAAENFNCYDQSSNKKHEAGYDAFVTGLCFISLTAKLASENKLDYVGPDSKIISPFVNRPYIMRHFDVLSLNLNGPDPEPSRDHVFYVTFPKEWKTVDLIELFFSFGEVYVSWLNDVSAFVALKVRNQIPNVRRTLLKETSSVYKVRLYSDYQDMQHVFKSPLALDRRDHASRFVASGPQCKKRKSSGSSSADGSEIAQSLTPNPEEENCSEKSEVRTEKQDNSVSTSHQLDGASPGNSQNSASNEPKPKKQKTLHDESGTNEVTSTEKFFDEPSVW